MLIGPRVSRGIAAAGVVIAREAGAELSAYDGGPSMTGHLDSA